MEEHFDVVVVGSGFGASASACRLAQAGRSVLILERGRSYPPGSFPRSPRGVAANLWDPSAGLYGMFDIWAFRGIESVVSSGLGGGSLIYANVMLRKDPAWFVDDAPDSPPRPWPVTYDDLEPYYETAETMMGAQRYPFDVAPYSATAKTRATRHAAEVLGLDWQLPPLAVSFASPGQPPVPGQPLAEEHPNLHGRARTTCSLCGECDAGCNSGPRTRSTTPTFPGLRTPGRRSAPCARCGGSTGADRTAATGSATCTAIRTASTPRARSPSPRTG